MWKLQILLLLAIKTASLTEAYENNTERSGKFLGLVVIEDEPCIGKGDTGVCKSSRSCEDMGMNLETSCGHFNLGVCCLPMISTTASGIPVTVTERVSLIKGEYQINEFLFPKLNDSCQLRVKIQGNFQLPTNGMCIQDVISFDGSITVKSLNLCGNLDDTLYLSYGGSEQIRISFTTNGNSKFEAKVEYIDCNSDERAPDICLLKTNSNSGQVKSFGFLSGNNGYQIRGLEYNICVGGKRPASTFSWEMCKGDDTNPIEKPDNMNSFYTTEILGNFGGSGNVCVGKTSYVGIQGFGTFCGGYFPKLMKVPSNIVSVKTVEMEDYGNLPYDPTKEYYVVYFSSDAEDSDCDSSTTTSFLQSCQAGSANPDEIALSKICRCTSTAMPIPPMGMTELIWPVRKNVTGFCLQYIGS